MRRAHHARSNGPTPDELPAEPGAALDGTGGLAELERELRELKAADLTAKRAGDALARKALGSAIANLLRRIRAAKGADRG